MYMLSLQGAETRVPLDPAKTLLDACLEERVALPYNCRSGECGQCVARLAQGTIHELPGADPATYTPQMRRDGLILTCMSFPRSDIVLDVPTTSGSQPLIRDFDAVVERVTWHGPRTAHVVLRCSEAVEYRGGQYFEWHLPGAGRARSYSAASVPGGTAIEFLVRIYPGGRVSAMLKRHEIAAGDVVSLRGPFGTYQFDDDAGAAAIFVAGGTGLAPVLSIVMTALARGSRRPMIVLFGARDLAELASAQALENAARSSPVLRFVPVLSDEPASSSWTGRRGMVGEFLRETLGDQFGAQAYLCGPAPMVDAVIPALERCGLASEDIYCDKFVPAGADLVTA
jgi:phenol/toluene 2-monooxygenase (NADH) P5/A5